MHQRVGIRVAGYKVVNMDVGSHFRHQSLFSDTSLLQPPYVQLLPSSDITAAAQSRGEKNHVGHSNEDSISSWQRINTFTKLTPLSDTPSTSRHREFSSGSFTPQRLSDPKMGSGWTSTGPRKARKGPCVKWIGGRSAAAAENERETTAERFARWVGRSFVHTYVDYAMLCHAMSYVSKHALRKKSERRTGAPNAAWRSLSVSHGIEWNKGRKTLQSCLKFSSFDTKLNISRRGSNGEEQDSGQTLTFIFLLFSHFLTRSASALQCNDFIRVSEWGVGREWARHHFSHKFREMDSFSFKRV